MSDRIAWGIVVAGIMMQGAALLLMALLTAIVIVLQIIM